MVSTGPTTVCGKLHRSPTSSTASLAVRSRSFTKSLIITIGIISSSVKMPITITFAAISRRGVHHVRPPFSNKFMSLFLLFIMCTSWKRDLKRKSLSPPTICQPNRRLAGCMLYVPTVPKAHNYF